MTNEEMLLTALANGATINPKFQPQNNKQAYLAYLCGLEINLPAPRTAEEALMRLLCENGGSGGGSVSAPLIVHSLVESEPLGVASYKSITIGAVESIAQGILEGCTNLESITIPFVGASANEGEENVEFGYIFGASSGNNSICVPKSLKTVIITGGSTIGDQAFGECTSLTSITIPNSVTSIKYGAFTGCTSLESITIPNSVTSIGNNAFGGCDSLKYNEYNNGKYLGNSDNPYLVLCGVIDKSVSSFTIPNDTKVIYDDVFFECTSLTSVTIPDSVTSIGSSAFSSCSSLTSISIPASVTSIGVWAFYGCGLTEINYEGTIAEWAAMDTQGIIDREGVPVHCTDGDTTASYNSGD